MTIEDVELMSTKAVSAATGLPPSTIFKMAEEGNIPLPVEIPGSRRVGWRKAEIREWLEGLQHRPARSEVA